jgi:hypothetical protein
MNNREIISFEDQYSRLKCLHCDMKIDVPMHSKLYDYTKFIDSVKRVKQYTYDVIVPLVDNNQGIDFSKVSIDKIHHIAILNDLTFTELHRDTHKNELTYMLTMWTDDVNDFNCYLIFTVC